MFLSALPVLPQFSFWLLPSSALLGSSQLSVVHPPFFCGVQCRRIGIVWILSRHLFLAPLCGSLVRLSFPHRPCYLSMGRTLFARLVNDCVACLSFGVFRPYRRLALSSYLLACRRLVLSLLVTAGRSRLGFQAPVHLWDPPSRRVEVTR